MYEDKSYNNSTHYYYPNPHSVLTHSHNPIRILYFARSYKRGVNQRTKGPS